MVIAIIAVLAALLLPSLASAKQAGRRAGCLSNLRQIGIAVQAYAHDNDGRRFTVDLGSYPDLYDAFNRILTVLEWADSQY